MSKSRAYSYLLIFATVTFALFSVRLASAAEGEPAANTSMAAKSTLVSKIPLQLDSVSSFSVCGSTLSNPSSRMCVGSSMSNFTANDTVKNLKSLLIGWVHLCGLDEDGVKCWSSGGRFEKPIQQLLSDGDALTAQLSYRLICVPQKDRTINCYFNQQVEATHSEKFGPFNDLRDYSVSKDLLCAIDGNYVKCFKFKRASKTVISAPTHEFAGAKSLKMTHNSMCILSSEGLDCTKDNDSHTALIFHIGDKWKSVVQLFHTSSDFICGIDKDQNPMCIKLGDKDNETTDVTPPELLKSDVRVLKFKAVDNTLCALLESTTKERFLLCGFSSVLRKMAIPQDVVDFDISGSFICVINAARTLTCFNEIASSEASPLPEDGSPVRASGTCRWNNSRFHCANVNTEFDFSEFKKIIATSIKSPSDSLPCVVYENSQGLRSATCLFSRTDDFAHPLEITGDVKGIVTSYRNRYRCVYGGTLFSCVGELLGGATAPNLSNIKRIEFADDFGCALDDFGLVCWGNDLVNRELSVPSSLTDINSVTDFSVGTNHVCAITNNRTVVCWGKNNFGQSSAPKLTNPTSIIAADDTTCASSDEGVTCWGQRTGPLLDGKK